MIVFTKSEIESMQENPDVLRALADWHSCRETEADAIGPEFSQRVENHKSRREELERAANKIEEGY